MSTTVRARRDPASRWTPALAKSWTPIADEFLQSYAHLEPPITSLEAMLIIQLIQHKWDAKAPFPGFKTLADRMGLTPTSVRNHARSLEKKGYLRREMRQAQTNRFHLDGLFKKLEEFQKAKPPKRSREKKVIGNLEAFSAELHVA